MAVGPEVQLGELRGLPQDCPSISPTSWVNKISLLPIDSSTFPAQAPRLCQFSLGNSGLKPARSSAISSVHPLPITRSEPQNLSHMGAMSIHIGMKGGRGIGGMERGMPPCYTTIAFCKILGFQYSWLLDGCNLAKFCMFMKWDYSTWETVHCA